MKKLVMLGLLILASVRGFAQDSVSHQHILSIGKVSLGAMITIAGTANFPLQEKPFDVWYGFAPSCNIFTGRTHHHVMYGMANNSIQTLHGYFLPNSFDVYVFYSQNLNSLSKKYAAVGIEKVVSAGEYVKYVFFGEVGSNLLGGNSMSFGVVIHPQMTIWGREN